MSENIKVKKTLGVTRCAFKMILPKHKVTDKFDEYNQYSI